MKIYLITDTHFNHEIIKKYCGRPDNYEDLIQKGLVQLKPEDLLIHLGDVCIGNDVEVHEKYIMPLECKKWLVRGNHDRKSNSWYMSHGWDFVGRQVKDVYFGKKILFSHKPKIDDGWYDLNIHGHFHNSHHRDQEPDLLAIKNDKHKLLAIEHHYQPVSLQKFIK